MKRCPITYEEIEEQETYSQKGLRLLSPRLENLEPLEYSAAEQRQQALERVGKMSIQGVQRKLSARLRVKDGRFDLVDQQGHYILKPQNVDYPESPENEALTMSLAASLGLEVPVHGLVYSKDKSLTYFVKRFDRLGHNKKLALEDFAQLLQLGRDTKYESSMEQVAKVINKFCTFPQVEALRLLRFTIFNFLVGNADMHLKNFSLITRNQKITLSPAYDLLNTALAAKDHEELALPLRGKKHNLRKNDFLEYFALEKLGLNQKVVSILLQEFREALPRWEELISYSFLSAPMQEKYLLLLKERCQRLEL